MRVLRKKNFVKMILTGTMLIWCVFSVKGEESAEQVFNYAEQLFSCEVFPQAIEQYLKVIYLLGPNNYVEEAEYKIGECLQREEKYWIAMDRWEKVIQKYPDSKWTEKAKESIKLTELLIQNRRMVEEYSLDLRDKLAKRYIEFGKDFLGRAAKQTEYGLVYEEREFNTAIYWFNKVLKDFPDSIYVPEAIDQIGYAYYLKDRVEDYKQAVIEYSRIVELYPGTVWEPMILSWIGDIYQNKLGDKKKAIETYQKVVDNSKYGEDDFYTSYAKTQIAILK